ncbi:MAG TPA: alpha/beta hydrolase [Stellaceae bacterium]|nr:alpha/beta hydrolase [Stellaceae bacterium]
MMRGGWLVAAAAFAALALTPAARAAEIARAITYDTVPRPAGLPDDFAPTNGASLRFLTITALDGNANAAALWQPQGKAAADTTIVVSVHGSGSNYHDAPHKSLGRDLSAKGYAVLATNTRQHDQLINTDNFYDDRRDIEAAVMTARALGYRRLVLHGHSLGNVQVQFYAATDWSPDVKAVILTGPFANLPWKSRNILIGSEESYKALSEDAMAGLRSGALTEPLQHKMHYITGQDVPVTAQHFLTYRSTEVSAADGTFWIRRIPYPILMVRDQADGIVLPFEPHMLLSAADAEGSLVTSIKFVLLPDPRPPSGDAHSFVGNEEKLSETVLSWLADQKL